MKKRSYIYLIIITMVLIPIAIDKLIIGNNYPSNISNENWVNFLGSYCGAIISAIATVIGIFVTIEYTRKEAQRDRELAMKQENENRRLQIAPYLKYKQCKTLFKEKHDISILYVPDDNDNKFINTTIIIKNVGMGPIVNLGITSLKFNNSELGYTLTSQDIIEKNEEIKMLIDFRFRLEQINQGELIRNPEGFICKYSVPDKYKRGGNLELLIEYNDLLENTYKQKIIINLSIAFEADKDEKEWKYSEPSFSLSDIGKTDIIYKE